MKRPKISVVVPVYNVKDYLEDCVNTLINQSIDDYEILLINDGSTDGSDKICSMLEKKYKVVKTYSKQNGGLSDARNFGVGKAKGEYVTFVDSDDYVNKFFLEKLLAGVTSQKCDISMCFYEKVPEKNIIEQSDIKKVSNFEVITRERLFHILLTPNVSTFYETGTCKLIKKEILEEVNFPVGILHEDTATSYRIFDKVDKVCIINDKLYYYRQREGSITHTFNEKRLDLINILIDRQEFFNKKNDKVLQKKHFIFMSNRFCRLRFEAKGNIKSYEKIDNSIKELLKDKTFKLLPIKQRISMSFWGKNAKVANFVLRIKSKFK